MRVEYVRHEEEGVEYQRFAYVTVENTRTSGLMKTLSLDHRFSIDGSVKRVKKIDGRTCGVIVCVLGAVDEEEIRAKTGIGEESPVLEVAVAVKYPSYRIREVMEGSEWPLHVKKREDLYMEGLVGGVNESMERYEGIVHSIVSSVYRYDDMCDEESVVGSIERTMKYGKRVERNVCVVYDNERGVVVGQGVDRTMGNDRSIDHCVMKALEDVGKKGRKEAIIEANVDASLGKKLGAEEREEMEEGEKEEEEGYFCKDMFVFMYEEPCIMCAMALLHSRISRLFFLVHHDGSNGMVGGCNEKMHVHHMDRLNHKYHAFRIVLPSYYYCLLYIVCLSTVVDDMKWIGENV